MRVSKEGCTQPTFPPLTPSGRLPLALSLQWGSWAAPSPGLRLALDARRAAPGPAETRLGWGSHGTSYHPPRSPVARLPSSAPGLWLAEGGGRGAPCPRAGSERQRSPAHGGPTGPVPLPAPAGGLGRAAGEPWRRQRGPLPGARSALQGSGGRGLEQVSGAGGASTRVPAGWW